MKKKTIPELQKQNLANLIKSRFFNRKIKIKLLFSFAGAI